MQGDGARERRRTLGALRTLQDGAERHLGGRVRTTTVSANNPHDVQRLALQLLENAGTISGPLTALPSSHVTGLSGTPEPTPTVWSH